MGRTTLRHPPLLLLLHRKRLLRIHEVRSVHVHVHVPAWIPHLLLHEHELPLLVQVHGVHVPRHLLGEIGGCYAGVYAGRIVGLVVEWVHASLLGLSAHLLLGLGCDG